MECKDRSSWTVRASSIEVVGNGTIFVSKKGIHYLMYVLGFNENCGCNALFIALVWIIYFLLSCYCCWFFPDKLL